MLFHVRTSGRTHNKSTPLNYYTTKVGYKVGYKAGEDTEQGHTINLPL